MQGLRLKGYGSYTGVIMDGKVHWVNEFGVSGITEFRAEDWELEDDGEALTILTALIYESDATVRREMCALLAHYIGCLRGKLCSQDTQLSASTARSECRADKATCNG